MTVIADDLLTIGTIVFLYTSLHISPIFVRLEIGLPLFAPNCRRRLILCELCHRILSYLQHGDNICIVPNTRENNLLLLFLTICSPDRFGHQILNN